MACKALYECRCIVVACPLSLPALLGCSGRVFCMIPRMHVMMVEAVAMVVGRAVTVALFSP